VSAAFSPPEQPPSAIAPLVAAKINKFRTIDLSLGDGHLAYHY
jgi:hypothetical protein